MDKPSFKLVGTLPFSKLRLSPTKLGPTLKRLFRPLYLSPLLFAAALSLPGCTTLSGLSASRSTVTTSAELCRPWQAIPYSSAKDTPKTVRAVRVHNKTGANLKCWKD